MFSYVKHTYHAHRVQSGYSHDANNPGKRYSLVEPLVVHVIAVLAPANLSIYLNAVKRPRGHSGRLAQHLLVSDRKRSNIDRKVTYERLVEPQISQSVNFVEIGHAIISTVIFPLPLNHSRRVVVSMCTKYWLTACSNLTKGLPAPILWNKRACQMSVYLSMHYFCRSVSFR